MSQHTSTARVGDEKRRTLAVVCAGRTVSYMPLEKTQVAANTHAGPSYLDQPPCAAARHDTAVIARAHRVRAGGVVLSKSPR